MADLIFPALNLGALICILVYFLRKPVADFIVGRQRSIRELVEQAEAKKIEANQKYNEFDKKLMALESEAQEILGRAKADGEALKVKMISTAKETAAQIIKEAEVTAEANVQDFKDSVRREVIAESVGMAEKMIRDGLSKADQKRMISDYVGKVR